MKSSAHYEGFIFLYTEKHLFDLLTETARLECETSFVFDHELAHAIIPDASGLGNRNMKECIADAYALIRHFQRYGADSAAIDSAAENRALHLVFRGDAGEHFTSPVIEEILKRRYDIEWNNLTPQETTKLASRFALKYATHPTLLGLMNGCFEDLQGKWEDIKKGNETPFLALVEKVLSAKVSHYFKYGAMALRQALDGHMEKTYGIVLKGKYWDDVRQKLAEKQETFEAQDESLFGLGGADRPLQASKPENNVIKFPAKFL